jgi:hypothetical protein
MAERPLGSLYSARTSHPPISSLAYEEETYLCPLKTGATEAIESTGGVTD